MRISFHRIVMFLLLIAALGFAVPSSALAGKGKGNKDEKGKDKSDDEEKGKGKGKDKGKGKNKDKGKDKDSDDESSGKKKGWGDSDVPPGIAKQGEEKVAEWKEKKNKAKERVRTRVRDRAKKQGKSDDDATAETETVEEAVETASNSGVAVEKVEDFLNKAIDGEIDTADIKETAGEIAEAVKKGVDPDAVGEKIKTAVDTAKAESKKVSQILREWAAKKVAGED